jgi:hypothetical protein
MHNWMIKLMNTYVRNVRFSYIRLYPWVYNASISLSAVSAVAAVSAVSAVAVYK